MGTVSCYNWDLATATAFTDVYNFRFAYYDYACKVGASATRVY